MSLKNAPEGFGNWFKKLVNLSDAEIENLSSERTGVCNSCPISDYGESKRCLASKGGCNCFIEAKTRAVDEACPIGKWGDMLDDMNFKDTIRRIKAEVESRKTKYFWLLDPGHGGIKDGKYVTAPNKMYKFEDGLTIYEGEVNRQITNELIELLSAAKIPYAVIPDWVEDTPLDDRVEKANKLHAELGNCVYVSIHCNAGGGTGYEVYTSVGQTSSDAIADVFYKEFEKVFPDAKMRSDTVDGDFDKEAHFYVLKNTTCPAVLTENFFMDNRADAEILSSSKEVAKIARAHFEAIKKISKDG